MRLGQLIKPIEEQTDTELLERLQQIRHNREIARPVSQAITRRSEKKESNKRQGNLQKMLEGFSPEEREALIKQLEEGQE